MANLLLHCGARGVDRDALRETPTPPPTDSWMPIPHHRLLDQVTDTLSSGGGMNSGGGGELDSGGGGGLEIVNQAHAVTADGNRYFGLLEMVNGEQHPDYNLVVGVRNSHDKSFSASIAVGTTVFVCDNLAFSAEVVLARKHTTHIDRDLPGVVERAVGRLGDLRIDQDRRIEAYKDSKLSDRQVHHLLIKAQDARVLPITRVPVALNEWRQPSHDTFAESGKTAWRFFNGVTESLKGRCLDELPRRTQALHGLVDTAIGLPRKEAASRN